MIVLLAVWLISWMFDWLIDLLLAQIFYWLIAQELYSWRDGVARIEDESTQYILPNHMLLKICTELPREMQVKKFRSFFLLLLWGK